MKLSSSYIRSLVYMLQASEYKVGDFLAWYQRTRDFRSVEKRKTLVKTKKAVVLVALMWILVLIDLLLALKLAITLDGAARVVAPLVLIGCLPFALPYMLVAMVSIVHLLQWPIEQRMIGEAKAKLAKHPALRIGIAGSYGKTTMREILKTVLSEGKIVSAPPGSYNTPLGICAFVNGLKGNEEVLIFELGEYYPRDIEKLCTFVDPQIGFVTGVNEAHLQKFGTLEATTKTIFELADWLKEKPVYVNGEDDLVVQAASTKHVAYSRSSVGEWTIENASTNLEGTTLEMVHENVRLQLTSKLLGLHHVGPIAASVHLGLRLGLTADQVKAGVAKTAPFAHRLSPRHDAGGVITLDDSYNGNPDGVKAIINFIAPIKDHRRWYVTPGLVEMGDRKGEVHREIGAQLAKAAVEKVVLIKNSVTPYIAEGLEEGGFAGELIWFDDALTAYAALPQLTVSGDLVILQNDWPDQYA